MAPGVFISYRRSDSRWVAGRLRDELESTLGEGIVFLDTESISGGSDFVDVIRAALLDSKVTIAVIGQQWRPELLADERDYVRLELLESLASGKVLIPVLVDQASMPTADEFPEELRRVARRHALHLRPDPDFRADVRRLVGQIEGLFRSRKDGLVGRAALKSFSLASTADRVRTDEAVAVAEQALGENANDVAALKAVGASSVARGQYPLAQEALKQSLRIDPNDAEARYLYAIAYLAGRSPEDLSDTSVAALIDVLEPDGRPFSNVPHHRALAALLKLGYYGSRGRRTRGAPKDLTHVGKARRDDREIAALLALPGLGSSTGATEVREALGLGYE